MVISLADPLAGRGRGTLINSPLGCSGGRDSHKGTQDAFSKSKFVKWSRREASKINYSFNQKANQGESVSLSEEPAIRSPPLSRMG